MKEKSLLWLHMNFEVDGSIRATFSRQNFCRGEVVSARKRTFVLRRSEMRKIFRLTLAIQRSHHIISTVYGFDGYSVCKVRLKKENPLLTNRGVPIKEGGKNHAR